MISNDLDKFSNQIKHLDLGTRDTYFVIGCLVTYIRYGRRV